MQHKKQSLPNEGFHHIECEFQISLAMYDWELIWSVEQITVRRNDQPHLFFEYCQLFISGTLHLEFTPNMLHHLGGWHVEKVQCGASHADGGILLMKLFDELCHSGRTGVMRSSKKTVGKKRNNSFPVTRHHCKSKTSLKRLYNALAVFLHEVVIESMDSLLTMLIDRGL